MRIPTLKDIIAKFKGQKPVEPPVPNLPAAFYGSTTNPSKPTSSPSLQDLEPTQVIIPIPSGLNNMPPTKGKFVPTATAMELVEKSDKAFAFVNGTDHWFVAVPYPSKTSGAPYAVFSAQTSTREINLKKYPGASPWPITALHKHLLACQSVFVMDTQVQLNLLPSLPPKAPEPADPRLFNAAYFGSLREIVLARAGIAISSGTEEPRPNTKAYDPFEL